MKNIKSNYSLFLDDVRDPKEVTWVILPKTTWIVVRNYKSFESTVLTMGMPSFVTYDHDLNDVHYGHGLKGDDIPYDSYKEKTGYDAAKWLVDYCMKKGVKHPPYMVHSMNPVGKSNIISYVDSYNRSYKN